jgi:hypothetical protein
MRTFLGQVSLPHVVTIAAVAALVGSGTTYAAQQVTGQQITNGTVTTKDLKNGTITGADVANGSLTGLDIKKNSVLHSDIKDGSLTGNDVARDALTSGELSPDSVGRSELITDAVSGDEVDDFSLTTQDIGLLTAKVTAGGVLQAGNGVTPSSVPTVSKTTLAGEYRVDFHTNINACTFTATVGEPTSTAFNAFGNASVAHYNSTTVEVTTTDTRGVFEDRPFHLIVVC